MEVITSQIANTISLTLRKPDAKEASPVIILCHGFCGIQEILLPDYAEAFTQAGFATVTFDYRGFGASGGERGRLVPSMQIEDILSVVEWVKNQPGLDAERIGLWGTSYGGCHVFGAAANNADIKCIVSQLAFANGETLVTGKMSEQEKQDFVAMLNRMAEKQKATGKEMFVGLTRVLSDEESKAFFETHKTRYPAMDIKIPFLTVLETLKYKPEDNAARVSCPTLVVVAGADTVNPPEQGRALFDAVSAQHKHFCVEEGARHYDMYSGQHFEHNIKTQINWFREYL